MYLLFWHVAKLSRVVDNSMFSFFKIYYKILLHFSPKKLKLRVLTYFFVCYVIDFILYMSTSYNEY